MAESSEGITQLVDGLLELWGLGAFAIILFFATIWFYIWCRYGRAK